MSQNLYILVYFNFVFWGSLCCLRLTVNLRILQPLLPKSWSHRPALPHQAPKHIFSRLATEWGRNWDIRSFLIPHQVQLEHLGTCLSEAKQPQTMCSVHLSTSEWHDHHSSPTLEETQAWILGLPVFVFVCFLAIWGSLFLHKETSLHWWHFYQLPIPAAYHPSPQGLPQVFHGSNYQMFFLWAHTRPSSYLSETGISARWICWEGQVFL